MRRLFPLVLRPWTLPLVVAAIAVPIIGGFAIGPPVGLAAGALAVAALLVIASRAVYDEPIEVARTVDARFRVLVLATRDLDDPATLDGLRSIVGEGVRATGSESVEESELLVVAPAIGSGLARWLSDVAGARQAAQERLAVSLAALAAAGLDARGSVGDPDPVQAVEDELHTFAAQEVVVVTGPHLAGPEIEEIRRRLDRPVRSLA